MADLKTKPSSKNVNNFLHALESPKQKEDAFELLNLMQKITKEKPVLWGPSIIGFGSYHYTYDSGHEGDMCRVGFSPRKNNLVIYLLPGFKNWTELLDKLGKHKVGVSCLYIKALADVDKKVLKDLIDKSFEEMNKRYPR